MPSALQPGGQNRPRALCLDTFAASMAPLLSGASRHRSSRGAALGQRMSTPPPSEPFLEPSAPAEASLGSSSSAEASREPNAPAETQLEPSTPAEAQLKPSAPGEPQLELSASGRALG